MIVVLGLFWFPSVEGGERERDRKGRGEGGRKEGGIESNLYVPSVG